MPAIPRDRITGLVLAGGLGRRMRAHAGASAREDAPAEGIDKGLIAFRGRAMVAHVIERLRPQVGRVVINANRNQGHYEAFGEPVLADAVAGFAGPLAGIDAALRALQTQWLVTVPCDSPFLPADLVARLGDAASAAGAPVAVARAAGRGQPVFALIHGTLRDDLGRFLAAGGRKIDAWYEPLGAIEVDFDDDGAFRNINTPADLARFEHDD